MTSASMKRIIWALGFLFLWILNDGLLNYLGKYPSGEAHNLAMLAIWLIPLFFFKDDPLPRAGRGKG